jgi:hypothetical protein
MLGVRIGHDVPVDDTVAAIVAARVERDRDACTLERVVDNRQPARLSDSGFDAIALDRTGACASARPLSPAIDLVSRVSGTLRTRPLQPMCTAWQPASYTGARIGLAQDAQLLFGRKSSPLRLLQDLEILRSRSVPGTTPFLCLVSMCFPLCPPHFYTRFRGMPIPTHVDTGGPTYASQLPMPPLKGLNSNIQLVKYRARGYRNADRFVRSIFFHLGGLDLSPTRTTA